MAPLLVCQACVSLIKNGFLQQVLGPALLQVRTLYVCLSVSVKWCIDVISIIYTIFSYLSQNSPEEITVATGYLTLFLLHITNVQLMRTFLQFIISGECDGQPVVNSLIQNISSDSQQVDIKSPSSLLFLLLLILLFSAFSLSSPE